MQCFFKTVHLALCTLRCVGNGGGGGGGDSGGGVGVDTCVYTVYNIMLFVLAELSIRVGSLIPASQQG